MYAVIRAGGKQYRVAPGDVIRVETVATGTDGQVEFGDVLAVSATEGRSRRPESERAVVGEVMEEGRGAKILVFHYKRKKQYKKLRGHRQRLHARCASPRSRSTASRSRRPRLPKKEPKVKKAAPVAESKEGPAAKKKAAKKAAAKKSGSRRRSKIFGCPTLKLSSSVRLDRLSVRPYTGD